MTSRSLLKENSGLLELIQRFLDPLLVVASGVALYSIQFGSLDFPRNYVFVLAGGFLLCLAVFLGLMLVRIPALYNLLNVPPAEAPPLWRF